MMHQPYYPLTQPLQPVVCLAVGYRQPSRRIRRRATHGRQAVMSKVRGETSPKQMREAGLYGRSNLH